MNWQLGIALYAAGISTLVLIWRLIEYYFEKAGRIKVRAKQNYGFFVFGDYSLSNPIWHITAKVTNFSKHKRLIDRPYIITDLKFDGKNQFSFIDLTDSTKYPLALKPGEMREIKFKKEDIDKEFKSKGVKKIKILIEDTLDKSYKSNWVILS
jgi:hypothetical protein